MDAEAQTAGNLCVERETLRMKKRDCTPRQPEGGSYPFWGGDWVESEKD